MEMLLEILKIKYIAIEINSREEVHATLGTIQELTRR